METKKTFEVVQIIPSTTYVTYHVEATSKEEAEELVDSFDDSIVKISENSCDDDDARIEYDVYELN